MKTQEKLYIWSGIAFVLMFAAICIYEGFTSGDAYIYGVQEGARFSYKDIPMFECAWCHRVKNLNRHHLVPQSADISLRDEATNIVVLCRDCHFVIGHRCNWRQFNPDVMQIVETYTNVVISANYNEQLQKPQE